MMSQLGEGRPGRRFYQLLLFDQQHNPAGKSHHWVSEGLKQSGISHQGMEWRLDECKAVHTTRRLVIESGTEVVTQGTTILFPSQQGLICNIALVVPYTILDSG